MRFLFTLLLLSGAAALMSQTASRPLTYIFSPLFTDSSAAIRVIISFDGEPDGTSVLNFQDDQFGEPGQMKFLHFGPQEYGFKVQPEPDSNRILVTHPPGQRVRIIYTVNDRQGNLPFYDYCCYMPIINKEYFHVQGGHLLVVPDHYFSDPKDINLVDFRWINFDKKWTINNSFGLDAMQKVRVTATQLTTSVFVGGNFDRYSFNIQNKPVHFVTKGRWTAFSNDTLVNLLHTIVEGHRTFWNDFADSIYTVTFLPINDAPWSDTSKFLSYGGSGLTNSFLCYATNNPGLNYGSMRYLFTHELMHHWIGTKIENATEEQQYWFSEGFTEYFTLKNMLRYGLITPDEFLEEFNGSMVQPHYANPKRAMPNDSINYRNFWSGDKNWEKLPYYRGCLYAFYLDNQLRTATNGRTNLDAVMLDILQKIRANPLQKLDHSFFKSVIQPHVGKKGIADFEQFIEQGVPIRFKKTPLPEGIEYDQKDIVFSSGPSKEVVTKREKFKDIPVFLRKKGISDDALKAAILK